MSESARIRAWTAEFADPSLEGAYREWARPANARYIQGVIWVAATVFSLFVLTDLARVGIARPLFALLAVRFATAGAAVFVARRLVTVTGADAVDRTAVAIEGIFLVGSAAVLAILYAGPSP